MNHIVKCSLDNLFSGIEISMMKLRAFTIKLIPFCGNGSNKFVKLKLCVKSMNHVDCLQRPQNFPARHRQLYRSMTGNRCLQLSVHAAMANQREHTQMSMVEATTSVVQTAALTLARASDVRRQTGKLICSCRIV